MATVNRRRVLSGVAGGLGLALVAPSRGLDRTRADVIVAGGGLAGLTAALNLLDAGLSVIVLEASARPGGRIHTAYQLPGQPELGAVEVGPLYARVRDMARRLDLPLEPRGNPVGAFSLGIGGQLVNMEDWPESPLNQTVGDERVVPPPALFQTVITQHNPLLRADDWLRPEARPLDISVHDWLKAQGLSDEGLRLVNEGLITADFNDTSILPSLQDGLRMGLARTAAGSRPSGGVDKFTGGTSRLTTAMADRLGDRLRVDQRVRAIAMNEAGVEITCESNAVFRSAFVIAAMPFPALRRIAVTPALTGVQADAVANMRWANTSQVFLRHRAGDYWERDGFAPSLWTDGPVNLYRQQVDSDRIVAVLVGRKADALDRLSPAEQGAFVVNDLVALRPELRGKVDAVATHSWREEVDIGGCRHDFRPGTVTRFVPAMFAPHARLHFAGEHTRLLEIGMESAMESGERAALEIVSGQTQEPVRTS